MGSLGPVGGLGLGGVSHCGGRYLPHHIEDGHEILCIYGEYFTALIKVIHTSHVLWRYQNDLKGASVSLLLGMNMSVC